MALLIKICGLKTPDAIDVAIDAGADMVGFVFFAPSPRNVGYAAARVLGERTRGRAKKVALSVDASDAELAAIVESLKPDLLQLHGKEAPERVAMVRSRFRLPVMKALPIAARADLSPIRLYDKVADRLIFDARPPRDATRPGGLGRTFDWRLLEDLRTDVPYMLSGGLDAGNVAEALRITRAPGVDVSSGVESAPGEKDLDKIRAFIRAARQAAQTGSQRIRERRMTVQQQLNSFRTGPDERGHFGIYGGRFVAETLMPLILDLEKAYAQARNDPAFKKEMDGHLTHYVGRPSPLYFAERLTAHLRDVSAAKGGAGGAKVYLKREDLNHTGAHKVNNVLGQIMLARRMQKPRVIAETGAGMHGVATATLCAKFGLKCVVYMGSVDVERQKPNVLRMKALGAEVRPVTSGSSTLKDAMNEALRDWVTNVSDTFYCIGTVAGPHPYPMMVRDFQSIIGIETRAQMQRGRGPPARLADRLHRRRLERDGAVPSLPRRHTDRNLRSGGGWSRTRNRAACRLDRGRPAGRSARQPHLSADERGRPDQRSALDFGRPRLSRHRARALLAQRHQAREVSLGDGRRSAGGVRALLQARRHHSGARTGARARARHGPRAREAEGPPDGRQPVGPRRQGPRQRRRLSRAARDMTSDMTTCADLILRRARSARLEECRQVSVLANILRDARLQRAPQDEVGASTHMISRQKLIGWILIVISTAFIVYFLRTRLFSPGPIIEKKEWVNFVGSVVGLFLGTINVRMAAMRERRRKELSN